MGTENTLKATVVMATAGYQLQHILPLQHVITTMIIFLSTHLKTDRPCLFRTLQTYATSWLSSTESPGLT